MLPVYQFLSRNACQDGAGHVGMSRIEEVVPGFRQPRQLDKPEKRTATGRKWGETFWVTKVAGSLWVSVSGTFLGPFVFQFKQISEVGFNMKTLSLLGLGAGLLAAFALTAGPVVAASPSTLDTVKKRGHLRCQIGTPSPGFYNLKSDGSWVGSDVAVCRAVAAAIFGDPGKVEFQSVNSTNRFTALANGESDMLSRTATWTLFRDTQLGLNFTAVNFYDGQGFMVTKSSGIKSALELKGARVCVAAGTTTELNLTDFSRSNDLGIEAVTFQENNVRNQSYLKGSCDAVTNDKSGLASMLAGFPTPGDHVILPETISKEPLAPAVRKGDGQWYDVVRWTVFALIAAEELGVNSKNVDEMAANPPSPEIARMLGVEGKMHVGLGLDPKWAHWIIKSVGNYGEIYDKYMGSGSADAIGIPREGSPNALWTKGGLMYAPPFR